MNDSILGSVGQFGTPLVVQLNYLCQSTICARLHYVPWKAWGMNLLGNGRRKETSRTTSAEDFPMRNANWLTICRRSMLEERLSTTSVGRQCSGSCRRNMQTGKNEDGASKSAPCSR